MHHLTLAARAVRASLITMGSASVLLSGITIAAEENTKVERIEVTGSRIKQVDMEKGYPFSATSVNM